MDESTRRSEAQTRRVMRTVEIEETARLDECEIIEFLKVARDFPQFFKPAEQHQQKEAQRGQ